MNAENWKALSKLVQDKKMNESELTPMLQKNLGLYVGYLFAFLDAADWIGSNFDEVRRDLFKYKETKDAVIAIQVLCRDIEKVRRKMTHPLVQFMEKNNIKAHEIKLMR